MDSQEVDRLMRYLLCNSLFFVEVFLILLNLLAGGSYGDAFGGASAELGPLEEEEEAGLRV